jgi:hypothetical protein
MSRSLAVATLLALLLAAMRSLGPATADTPPDLADSDGDGCVDRRELLTEPGSEGRGGRRDPNNFWDWFDTPDQAGVRNQAITISDVANIIPRFGSSGPATGVADALALPPPAPAYHAGYDRTLPGPYPWSAGPANGSITIQDIVFALKQFGMQCVVVHETGTIVSDPRFPDCLVLDTDSPSFDYLLEGGVDGLAPGQRVEVWGGGVSDQPCHQGPAYPYFRLEVEAFKALP